MAAKKEARRTGWREVWGILLLASCMLMFLSVISYVPGDIVFLQDPPNDPARNYVGPAGAWFSFVLFMLFGVAGYLSPAIIAGIGVMLLVRREGRVWVRTVWILLIYLSLTSLVELQDRAWSGTVAHLNLDHRGGLAGYLIASQGLVRLMGVVGTVILLVAVALTGLCIVLDVHPWVLTRRTGSGLLVLFRRVQHWLNERRDPADQLEVEARGIAARRKRLEAAMRKRDAAMARQEDDGPRRRPAPPPVQAPPDEESLEPEPPVRRPPRRPSAPVPPPEPPPTTVAAAPLSGTHYQLPPLSLLAPYTKEAGIEYTEDHLAASTILQETLAEFGIDAKVTNVERGPVVTRYELLPAPGVRLEKIVSLSNNIALVMKAESVRVQAPIPGKGVVGIEVPNSSSSMVFMREVMESAVWRSGKHALPLALGKDVGGHVIVGDLADMPHMLIAGATGSGKTVCMNSILAGLLMSRTPDEMRLMLIDPKIVEFSGYEGLPHLVVPVITDPKKVSLGLRWAINEMENRYKLFAKCGVRNIKGFNARPIVKQPDLFAGEEPEAKDRVPDRLPYIVIIVDELADLMLVAQAEIETSITRLAQLSRAVGIHMILATQRPSVNVITGTIKANFPARIAFQVAQKVDSRTILDASGADKLLGKGDLLFLPPGSAKLLRAQGTMTSDEEIRKIVEHIRAQGGPRYEGTIKEKMESKAAMLPEMEEDNEMLEAAIEVIRQTRRASTSSLQRRLRIGYTRAARLMDLLEERGLIGPPQGSDPREILIDLDGEIPQNEALDEPDD
jgi:DNA segregation ATPase FtsK/SpoIIIE, S-DNA-T family